MDFMKKPTLFLIAFLIILTACSQSEPEPTSTPEPEPTAVPTNTAVPEPTEEPTPEPEPSEAPTAVPDPIEEPDPEPTIEPTPEAYQWPDPAAPYEALSRAEVTDAESNTYANLNNNLPPDRDDVLLAVAYRGITPPTDEVPLVETPLTVGTRQQIFVSNTDTNETSSPTFVLEYVSEHAYFWFDTTVGLSEPEEQELIEMGEAFDIIYEEDTFYFGQESNPGIDGDPRVHIVNASPLTICDVTEANSHTCGLLGYVATSNVLPQEVYPTSNEREMFVMNGAIFGGSTYLDVLAHEFRHMIEERYDVNDTDWAVEGSAMLAEDLLGFPQDPIARGNVFLSNPDQQLNRWTEGNPIPYYGQGYVINRYLFNRLGQELYKAFATSPLPGFVAIDAIAEENELGFTGLELWQDWLTALAIHTNPNAPELYMLKEGLDTASSQTVNRFPFNETLEVNQFASDYYQLFGEETVTVNFTGSNHAALLAVQPPSGQSMYLANRANYSHVRMTRAFDLTAVSSATFEYAVYHEIEKGFDFAYLSISTDGGISWEGLTAENMQGDLMSDDPSDVAYTDFFYTGRSREWIQESVDLTPYVGGEVHIRFEYVTDPILTFGGLAVDNIAIPELDYFDDAEVDSGWELEGFARATGYVPQQWYVQLITFENDTPIVQKIDLAADNTASFEVSLDSSGGGRPILIVAASAPMSLESATYQLDIE